MDRKYEVLVLLRPTLSADELTTLVAKIEEKLAGNIVKKEDWGKKKLAYKIQKFEEAFYILYYIETTSTAIADLKEFIAISKKDVLRPLILRHEKAWPFDRKTSKELKYPERKPRTTFNKRPNSRPNYTRSEAKPEVKKDKPIVTGG